MTDFNDFVVAATAASTATVVPAVVDGSTPTRKLTVSDFARTMLDDADGAAVCTTIGAVPASLYDVNSILYATSDNTPVALTVSNNRLVGRLSAGIAAISLDFDLTSVSGSDDSVPSAKAVKTALDLKADAAGAVLTGTTTLDRILPAVSSAADPTSLDWTGTKDVLTWTFTANRTITSSNVPTTAGVVKTIYASAASGGPWVPTFTGGTITPSGDAMSVPASGTVVITLETIGGGAFTVSQRLAIADTYGLQTALDAKAPLVSPSFTTPALGTPTSGTLTNCTGLPVAGISASTSTALGVGSIELGHASDTTIERSAAGVATIEGVRIATLNGVNSVNATGNLVNNTINEFYGSTAAQTLTLPTMADGDSLIVDNTSSVSVTIGRNSQTINGASADDTLTSGKAVTYYWRASGALRRIGALS